MQPLNIARILGVAGKGPRRLSRTLEQANTKPLTRASPSGRLRGSGNVSWFQGLSCGCSTSTTPHRASATRSSVNRRGFSPERTQVKSTDQTGIR